MVRYSKLGAFAAGVAFVEQLSCSFCFLYVCLAHEVPFQSNISWPRFLHTFSSCFRDCFRVDAFTPKLDRCFRHTCVVRQCYNLEMALRPCWNPTTPLDKTTIPLQQLLLDVHHIPFTSAVDLLGV